MSQIKTKPFKAIGGYNKKSPTENLAFANAVHSGLFTNAADYPTPPIDEATFVRFSYASKMTRTT